MEKTVLNEVFGLLKEIGAVGSESEFSTDWLGRSECYMRSLRCRKIQPSIGTLAICASKLAYYGNKLKEKQKHIEISDRMLQLSEACNQQINCFGSTRWME